MRRYCKKCGKISEAETEIKFCGHCGAEFEPIGLPAEEKPAGLPPVTPMAQAQAHTHSSDSGGFDEPKYCPWEDKAKLGFIGALFDTWKASVFEPGKFFRRMPTTGGIGSPLLYGLIMGMIGVIFALMYDQLFGQLFDMSRWFPGGYGGYESDFEEMYALTQQMQSVGMLIWLLVSPIVLTIGMFIGSGITHLILLIFGWSKTSYEGTFRATGYSYGPYFFQVVPFLGNMITSIWTLVIFIIAIKEVHKLSVGKTILVVFLPLILFCLCCCGFVSMILGMAGISS